MNLTSIRAVVSRQSVRTEPALTDRVLLKTCKMIQPEAQSTPCCPSDSVPPIPVQEGELESGLGIRGNILDRELESEECMHTA